MSVDNDMLKQILEKQAAMEMVMEETNREILKLREENVRLKGALENQPPTPAEQKKKTLSTPTR
jgi:hypothetical protein